MIILIGLADGVATRILIKARQPCSCTDGWIRL